MGLLPEVSHAKIVIHRGLDISLTVSENNFLTLGTADFWNIVRTGAWSTYISPLRCHSLATVWRVLGVFMLFVSIAVWTLTTLHTTLIWFSAAPPCWMLRALASCVREPLTPDCVIACAVMLIFACAGVGAQGTTFFPVPVPRPLVQMALHF